MIHPDWCYDAVLYEMNIRQLTPEGTLRAATQYLPQLRLMGVDAVWLMPIYPIGVEGRKGSLGSYYSIRDYCAVNEAFGTMEELDAFVREAHRLGMKVLLDWVANHTARDARWISEKPASWYERDEAGEAKIPWDWSDTAQLNYAEKEVWQGQIDAMKFWVSEHAIDGFRCDMAMLVPIEFWQQVREQLQSLKPDIFLLAEAEEDNLFDHAFDACYAWKMHHIMCDIAQGKARTNALREHIHSDLRRFGDKAIRMTFTSNHDENSWSGSEFARFGEALGAMSALSFLLPHSMPLIYTGQEFGYDHSFLFFDKDPMPNFEANDYTQHYRTMCRIKHCHKALRAGERSGSFIEIGNNAQDCLLTFVREADDDRVVALFNLSPYTVFADFHTGIYAGEYRDEMTGERATLHEHTWGDVEPWSYKILSKKIERNL
ncbi:MAG: alpha amylase C-terminal domain-containing protein [Alistipes sp.]|nr:alpha amylase C-terminal domain-containing protein [Alistipes sp.]